MSVLELNSSNFNDTINSGKTVLVDFWATWCMPCKMQAPAVEKLADELDDNYIIAKVNVDAEPDIAMQYSVMSIPTLICFKNGTAFDRTTGVTSKEELLSMIKGVKV